MAKSPWRRATSWKLTPVPGLAAGGLDRQHQARAHRPAINDDGARAAGPVLAAKVGAGEIEVIPQEVRQRLARLR